MQQILSYTEKDFDNLSWHDNHVYGIFLEKDTEGEDWKSDVIFDIDFITDWLCGIDTRVEFMIAAATLRFHDVTDLKINIDWGNSNFQTILNYFSIDSIERSIVQDQRICLDHPYFNLGDSWAFTFWRRCDQFRRIWLYSNFAAGSNSV